MAQVKDLTKLTLEDLWSQVKFQSEDWWEEIEERQLRMVKEILEGSLEEELITQLGAARYKRTRSRRSYRNGHYERSFATKYGVIKCLRVPRARESYESKILPRYQRRQDKVHRMIREMFLCGVSTRKVGEVLKTIGGENISPQTVSRVLRSLDREVRLFHRRPLADIYQYLFLDGICLKVKGAVERQKRMVLCAYGIRRDGKREIISFRQAKDESEAKWEAFLSDLHERGLTGRHLKLVITDGCPGLHRALDTVYPYVGRQRCWAHKLRNVANNLRRVDQKECISQASRIYLAGTKREAVRCFREWEHRWQRGYPNAVKCLAKDLDELLTFLDVPAAHRVKVRTTNVIERSFREVRRRTRPMTCFSNSASVDRIIYGVISHLNRNWKEKPLW
ncbi:MAG: IS256 family transposase, partial [Dehalococcoidia bacterium]|nr:IS256 family transposase [Dehalococcoidia bacterium]